MEVSMREKVPGVAVSILDGFVQQVVRLLCFPVDDNNA